MLILLLPFLGLLVRSQFVLLLPHSSLCPGASTEGIITTVIQVTGPDYLVTSKKVIMRLWRPRSRRRP